MDNIYNLLDLLQYGRAQARKAREIYKMRDWDIAFETFCRQLRFLSAEARKLGHRVIGDDAGYYVALNDGEWHTYRNRRFAAIKDELVSLAGPEQISVRDLIKLVYKVDVDSKNYELML